MTFFPFQNHHPARYPHTHAERYDYSRQAALLKEYNKEYPPNLTRTIARVASLRMNKSFMAAQDETGISYDVLNCPSIPPRNYPASFFLQNVVKNWNPNNATLPSHVYQGLCVFDYTRDLQKALAYRELEVPFVLVNTPSIWKTVERWNFQDYLSTLLGNSQEKVEHATSPHLMYWKLRGFDQVLPKTWTPPTDITQLSYNEWLLKANSTITQKEYYYFRLNAVWGGLNSFLYNELPFFQPLDENFFMVEPLEQRGINCRFGHLGILAEFHYDSSRNFIVVLKGSRRYILAHPSECNNLALYPKTHPSARHGSIDLTNLIEVQQHLPKAKVNEVVLQAGDALYLPTHWFHFIQNLDTNYQCNARSGITNHYVKYIQACGFPH